MSEYEADKRDARRRLARPRLATALVASVVALALAGCGSGDPGVTLTRTPEPVPSFPTEVSSRAQVVADRLPAPPEQPMPDAAAAATVRAFADAAARIVAGSEDLTSYSCSTMASDLERATTPDELFAAAGTIVDPELRSLVLHARREMGTLLSVCTGASAGDLDPEPAREAVAVLRARLPAPEDDAS